MKAKSDFLISNVGLGPLATLPFWALVQISSSFPRSNITFRRTVLDTKLRFVKQKFYKIPLPDAKEIKKQKLLLAFLDKESRITNVFSLPTTHPKKSFLGVETY